MGFNGVYISRTCFPYDLAVLKVHFEVHIHECFFLKDNSKFFDHTEAGVYNGTKSCNNFKAQFSKMDGILELRSENQDTVQEHHYKLHTSE